MSAAHGANPHVTRVLIYGVAIIFFAAVYDMRGWDFLNRTVDLTSSNTGSLTSTGSSTPTLYKVTNVTDGDTIHITKDGVDEKVRLLGINTPETVDPRRPVQCYGVEASRRMKELADGKSVRLETDDTQQERDAYGRILAYVYLEDGQMLNRKMIAEGYAYEYTYFNPYKYQSEFRSLQNLAKASKRGLWADTACHGSLEMPN
jgi:micrococcal nuclease